MIACVDEVTVAELKEMMRDKNPSQNEILKLKNADNATITVAWRMDTEQLISLYVRQVGESQRYQSLITI